MRLPPVLRSSPCGEGNRSGARSISLECSSRGAVWWASTAPRRRNARSSCAGGRCPRIRQAAPGQVICATGFKRGFANDRLLVRLVADHGLDTAEDWIVLDPDSTVPALTDGGRTLSLAGVPGQWAFPAADTLAGAKYAARRFLSRVKTCRTR
jgi:hypothetical protein